MQSDAVKVPVAASVPFECEFWPENGGWTGSCSPLAVAARGNNFAEAKKNMEEVLRARIESILGSRSGHAAA
jgi:predicted RNase H-like HicB family nuclease